MAQGVGPEFKPQNCQKNKLKKEEQMKPKACIRRDLERIRVEAN
jgi:hypothetical protein